MFWQVATFYQFVQLEDCEIWQQRLLQLCERWRIYGTILLASEGINGTVAGGAEALDALFASLKSDPRFAALEPKFSEAAEKPFERLKIKVKREIVTIGLPEVDPTQGVGEYVPPEQWNQLLSDPEVLVIDTRNDYEVGVGTFEGAVNPQTQTFREFPAYAEQHLDPAQGKKIAMFCTGGIRCEKATALLRQRGFDQVYHLQGGILNYLATVPQDESRWQGECFVFDERVSLVHGLQPGTYDLCYACGNPISEADKASEAYVVTVSCPHCIDRREAGA